MLSDCPGVTAYRMYLLGSSTKSGCFCLQLVPSTYARTTQHAIPVSISEVQHTEHYMRLPLYLRMYLPIVSGLGAAHRS